ncbi:hypothetical protein T439DRAFT_345199 [Meredithblackwellia eburnea MCA 4105]
MLVLDLTLLDPGSQFRDLDISLSFSQTSPTSKLTVKDHKLNRTAPMASYSVPPFYPPPYEFVLNIGGLLFGVTVGLVLIGVIICQAIRFLSESKRREPLLKCLISLVVVVQACDPISSSLGLFDELVKNYGNYTNGEKLSVYFRVGLFVNSVPGIFFQLWLLTRVYTVSRKNKILTGSLLLPVLGSGTLTLLNTATRLKRPFVRNDLAGLTVILPLTLCWVMATDLLLSTTFIICVYRESSQVIHDNLRAKLIRVGVVAIQGCIPTTLASVITLILSRAIPAASVYVDFQVLMSPLYIISMLYTLNSREDAVSEDDLLCTRCRSGSHMVSGGTASSTTQRGAAPDDVHLSFEEFSNNVKLQ